MTGFDDTTRNIMLEDFFTNINHLKKLYSNYEKEFSTLCDRLDSNNLNENESNYVIKNLYIISEEINILQRKIKEMTEIVTKIKSDIEEES